MTHDDITQFAAAKLGKTIKQGPVVIGFEEERMEWFEVDAHGEVVDNFEPLTSGDLLLAGMDALLSEDPCWIFQIEAGECSLFNAESEAFVVEKRAGQATAAFWTCWAQVEAATNGGKGNAL